MHSPDPPTTRRLRELLHDAAAPPTELARALLAERTALADDDALAYELLSIEQRWLERRRVGDAEQTRAAVAALRRDWLRLRVRHLTAAAPDVSVLLDLAEAEAAAVTAGEPELAGACRQAIEAGLLQVGSAEPPDEEVAERFALLTTAIDELAMDHQVALLRRTGEVVTRVGQRTGSAACRRLGRRLTRAGDVRELARRLEARIGRRGVAVLEGTNFTLLMVVLVTLLIEATVELSPAQLEVFNWIDALACTFFIADFALEIVLHPARWSWFWRNALTDLLPAIPSVMFLLPSVEVAGAADNLLLLRVLRLLRVAWAARYVQALRPLLRAARLLLFLVRGLDGLAARFAQILNRDFVFVPSAAEIGRSVGEDDRRDLLFAALRREHELVELLPQDDRLPVVRERIAVARAQMERLPPAVFRAPAAAANARDIAIGDAIEFLWGLRSQDLGRWLRRADVQALDRVVRVLSAVPVRWLPLIRRVAVHPLPAAAEDRIVALARRIADWLESWHGRMLFFADLHGIVTGPQILDRVSTAMVKATQRPAVRLLLFGALFLLFDSMLHGTGIAKWLGNIVGKPLILLGSFCLVFLVLGHWLKRLAGQASENYRLTSEAHFISQLERVQLQNEDVDLDFLTRRAFGDGEVGRRVRAVLAAQLDGARTGVPVRDPVVPADLCLAANRVALLYLHFLDGAPLHQSDVKTTEQLLANQSLENLRGEFLGFDARERRKLRKLKLDDGSLFSGPYLWFRFITESVAVEAAKRIAGYNQACIPLAERQAASPAALQRMADWLQRRRDPRRGRSPKEARDAAEVDGYPTTEFTALDFLGGDAERDVHLAQVFGDDVLEVVRFDRRTMVREIFGTRPINHLPKHERSFNPLRFYERRLSHGRVLLAPLLLVWRFFRSLGWVVVKVRQIVREVVDPELAMARRELGEAPFAVALRKIHRMKAPGLLAAIELRLRLDPLYSGAPTGWSQDAAFADEPEVERDLAFLHLREREAVRLRDLAAEVRHRVAALHAATTWLPPLGSADGVGGDAETVRAGELAVTCAWIADKEGVRTLMGAERWRAEVLPALLEERARPGFGRRLWLWVRGRFAQHPVDAWLGRHGRGLPAAARGALHVAYTTDDRGTRSVVDAWRKLPEGTSPTSTALATLRRVFRQGPGVRRDLLALRTVQSLAVLDVRNYRDLVFRIGDYAADGEDPGLARDLP